MNYNTNCCLPIHSINIGHNIVPPSPRQYKIDLSNIILLHLYKDKQSNFDYAYIYQQWAEGKLIFVLYENEEYLYILNKVPQLEYDSFIFLRIDIDEDKIIQISLEFLGDSSNTRTEEVIDISTKQDILTAGAGIKIQDNVISIDLSEFDLVTKEELQSALALKLDLLIQGDNIIIEDSTISAIVPTKLSEFENDEGFLTEEEIDTALSGKADYFVAGNGLQLINGVLYTTSISELEIDRLIYGRF